MINFYFVCTNLILGKDEYIPGSEISVNKPLILQIVHSFSDLLSEITQDGNCKTGA